MLAAVVKSKLDKEPAPAQLLPPPSGDTFTIVIAPPTLFVSLISLPFVKLAVIFVILAALISSTKSFASAMPAP